MESVTAIIICGRRWGMMDPLTTYYWKPMLSQTLYISKLWTAVCPSNMAAIGVKLRENAFQTIPDISFFNAENVKKNQLLQNFERPFTPWGWLCSASNFAKTRFRRSPTFHLSTSKNIFRPKFLLRRRKKKSRESSETRFPKVGGWTEPSSGGKRPFKVLQKISLFFDVFAIEKGNVGDRLKRVFTKFEAERSHPRGVNGRSKFWNKNRVSQEFWKPWVWMMASNFRRKFSAEIL